MTPEDYYTPEEINHPDYIQLWVARTSTPPPRAWNDALDPAFVFAGMVLRDLGIKERPQEPLDVFVPDARSTGTGPLQLDLKWTKSPRSWRWTADRYYRSLVFADPVRGSCGVFGTVRLDLLWAHEDGGATCKVTAFHDEAGCVATWYAKTQAVLMHNLKTVVDRAGETP